MVGYARIYNIYYSFLSQILRFLTLLFIIAVIVYNLSKGEFLNTEIRISLFLIIIFFMINIYIKFKVAKVKPKSEINIENNPYYICSFEALAIVLKYVSTENIIKELLEKKQTKFILDKANIERKDIKFLDLSKDALLNQAQDLAKKSQGKYITSMDLFISYLFLTESTTKLLFNKELKEKDLLNILHWARNDFKDEERTKTKKVHFWGEGIGEDWIYGWTPESKKYILDLTSRVVSENPVLVGRKKEYQQIIELLSKTEKNNVLLIGHPGSGKTTLVDKLAFDSFLGQIHGALYHKRFFELLTGSLLAGATNQGDLESRLQEVLTEISHAGNIILFIPELQNILGSSSYNLDLSGALLPYVKSGNLRIIATATPSEYKAIIEGKHTFLDFFEVIKLEEPSEEEALQMLLEKAHVIERKNKVSITYKAVVAAVIFSKKFIQDRFLPGASVILLDDVASRVLLSKKRIVENSDVTKYIEEKTNVAISAPTSDEKELLLHLEDRLHERIIDQQEAITAISESIRRIRSGLSSGNKPISFLFLGPTGVGKTETAKALAALYFGGEERIIRLDMSEYVDEDGVRRLLGAPVGEQGDGELTDKIKEHPFSLILLDEFEKAHPKILDLFLQVFDDGRLTDNKGKTISFGSSIIISTSNAGAEFIREEIQKGSLVDKNFQQRLLDLLQTKGIFKPELLNRFDAVIVFKPLGEKEAKEIVKLLLKDVEKKLLDKDIVVKFDNKIVEKIVKEGIDSQFGARPLRRFIQDNIEDMLAQKILKDEIKRGTNITFSTGNDNNIILNII